MSDIIKFFYGLILLVLLLSAVGALLIGLSYISESLPIIVIGLFFAYGAVIGVYDWCKEAYNAATGNNGQQNRSPDIYIESGKNNPQTPRVDFAGKGSSDDIVARKTALEAIAKLQVIGNQSSSETRNEGKSAYEDDDQEDYWLNDDYLEDGEPDEDDLWDLSDEDLEAAFKEVQAASDSPDTDFETEFDGSEPSTEETDLDEELSLDAFEIKYIYHITHINNLGSILEYGLQSHSNAFVSSRIDNTSVNNRRDRIEAINGRNIHSYVPFYFNPKNPMLYVNREIQDDIIVLAFDISLILKKDSLFTDGNAAVTSTEFFHDLADLVHLNWDCINAKYWNNFADGKRERMAEVLVLGDVDKSYLQKVYCHDKRTKRYIKELDSNISVKVSDKFYF